MIAGGNPVDTQTIMEGNLRWIREHFADRLEAGGAHLDLDALRDGLMLLIDMRFSSPPDALYQRIGDAPAADLLRWAAMTFQVGGLVAVCQEILQEK